MSGLSLYTLHPADGAETLNFHFGRQGIGLEEASETLSSDSLFAALVAQSVLRAGTRLDAHGAPMFARPFVEGEPPFLISSLFPRLGPLPLLPRPLMKLQVAEQLRTTIGKGFKKLRYLSPALFAMVCRGAQIDEEPIIMQEGKVWISRNEAATLPAAWAQGSHHESQGGWWRRLSGQKIWQIEALPHAAIDRASSSSAYYEVGRVTYAPGAGLALLVRFSAAAAQPEFERLLSLLSESGLGGRRSSGYGAFRWVREQDVELNLGQPGRRALLLSRYIPQPAELPALRSERAAYQLVRVGGWFYSPGQATQRRKRVMMVAEGALLDTEAAPVRGAVVDVRPDATTGGPAVSHPVYRSGLALTIPLPDQGGA